MKTILVLSSLAALTVAQANVDTTAFAAPDDQKQFCFWIGGPAMLEYSIPNSQFTLAAGFAPLIVNDSSTGLIADQFGWAAEGFYFTNNSKSGLGLMVRGGSAGGNTYVGPGVFYVSRPKSAMTFRYGVSFPFGGDSVHFLPEIAVGFQF